MTMSPQERHAECVRVSKLANAGKLLVLTPCEGGFTSRPFRIASEQPVLEAWDRICHADRHGQHRVWVEAWPYGAIRPTFQGEPEYLEYAEIIDDEA